MPTSKVTLTDGSSLKTRAVSSRKAKANIAHRLSFTHGYRNAYAMIQSVQEDRPEYFMAARKPTQAPRSASVQHGSRSNRPSIPSQAVLGL